MITTAERKKYLLREKRDIRILDSVHGLEKLRLSDYERFILLLTRTQLEDDWRKYLLQTLDVMKKNSKKYPKSSKDRIKRLTEFADKKFWRA